MMEDKQGMIDKITSLIQDRPKRKARIIDGDVDDDDVVLMLLDVDDDFINISFNNKGN